MDRTYPVHAFQHTDAEIQTAQVNQCFAGLIGPRELCEWDYSKCRSRSLRSIAGLCYVFRSIGLVHMEG